MEVALDDGREVVLEKRETDDEIIVECSELMPMRKVKDLIGKLNNLDQSFGGDYLKQLSFEVFCKENSLDEKRAEELLKDDSKGIKVKIVIPRKTN